jgi:hypothetical protein
MRFATKGNAAAVNDRASLSLLKTFNVRSLVSG